MSSVTVSRLDEIRDILQSIRRGLVGDLPTNIAEAKGVQHEQKTLDKASTFTDTEVNLRNFNAVIVHTDGNIEDITYKIVTVDTEESETFRAVAIPQQVGAFRSIKVTNATAETGKTVYIEKFLLSPILLAGLKLGVTGVNITGIIEKGSLYEQNQAASTDYFGTNISPTKTPCMHRIYLTLLTVAEGVWIEMDDSGDSYTDKEIHLNTHADLTAGAGYIFDLPLIAGQSYNIQHETTAESVICFIIEYPNFTG